MPAMINKIKKIKKTAQRAHPWAHQAHPRVASARQCQHPRRTTGIKLLATTNACDSGSTRERVRDRSSWI